MVNDRPSESGNISENIRDLDVRGLHCPLPILRARKALTQMTAGERLLVAATDPASAIDFKHFCNTTAHTLAAHWIEDGVLYYQIICGGDDDAAP